MFENITSLKPTSHVCGKDASTEVRSTHSIIIDSILYNYTTLDSSLERGDGSEIWRVAAHRVKHKWTWYNWGTRII